LDADSKPIVSYLVGGRDAEYAMWFMDDLAARLAKRVQLTSDGHRAYLEAIEGAFGCDVDYAQLVKLYGATVGAPGPYSPAECTRSEKIRREGNPDIDHASTSYVERQNLTIRMHMRRFTRLTNPFSKNVENRAHAVALHMMYYNFVRIHKTLRVTPAMAAGVADRLWEIGDIVQLVADAEEAPRRAGRIRSGRADSTPLPKAFIPVRRRRYGSKSNCGRAFCRGGFGTSLFGREVP
jgi:hypothetical protein